ncbi:MAG TPA: hypothetical protein VKZ79_06775 [Alphaproteobacteria bacterium]|nr:hypothetical protein [Alphaproteobacteria bacterium]
MRPVALMIVSISMLIAMSARAQPVDGGFDLGVWHGSPASNDGGFASCGMEALFGRRDSPVALTIGLDRLRGWTVTLRSDEFMMHTGGRIKAGLAFDDEIPVDVTGDVVNPTTVSFRFLTTALLDRHQRARKLVLVLSDAALPFALSQFEEAMQALRGCVAANVTSSSEQPAAAPLAIPVSAAIDLKPSEAQPADARLLSRIVTPLMVGFVGSVLLVLLLGAVLFQIVRARAQSRYFRLWTAEYRASVTPVLAMGLLDRRAAA